MQKEMPSCKTWGAVNAPCSVDAKGDDNKAWLFLQELREEALYYAIKYRYDPTLGRAHSEYLNKLNVMLQGR